ncbi:MAG: ABC transporter permease [Isosphaeraceae bacterium]
MKYLGYIFRNVLRNPVRTLLTVASLTVSLALVMLLAGFITASSDSASSLKVYNRLVVMNSQGFARPLPIARVREIADLPGVKSISPFVWFGGKFGDESVPFAQFAVDAKTFREMFPEYSVPDDQYKTFLENPESCIIGRKLAEDRGWKVGDSLPLRADLYPFYVNFTIAGIYDGPQGRDLRRCMFHWEYLDERLKQTSAARAGNAGVIYIKCDDGTNLAQLAKDIDDSYRNSDSATRTQTEEAFASMFAEFLGSVRKLITLVGIGVVVSLVMVAGNAMAMAMRERTTEVAVLRAIGFGKALVLGMVLAESVIVAGMGGLFGSLGSKLFADAVDLSKFISFVPVYFIPWPAAIGGLLASLAIGFLSGLLPALIAANTSVIDGLRKVV